MLKGIPLAGVRSVTGCVATIARRVTAIAGRAIASVARRVAAIASCAVARRGNPRTDATGVRIQIRFGAPVIVEVIVNPSNNWRSFI